VRPFNQIEVYELVNQALEVEMQKIEDSQVKDHSKADVGVARVVLLSVREIHVLQYSPLIQICRIPGQFILEFGNIDHGP
jgi:hypothetical protein